jgi:hypothetical protein
MSPWNCACAASVHSSSGMPSWFTTRPLLSTRARQNCAGKLCGSCDPGHSRCIRCQRSLGAWCQEPVTRGTPNEVSKFLCLYDYCLKVTDLSVQKVLELWPWSSRRCLLIIIVQYIDNWP